jgi:hypothetical protein
MKHLKRFNESWYDSISFKLSKILENEIWYNISRGSSVYFDMESETKDKLVREVNKLLNVDESELKDYLFSVIPTSFVLGEQEEDFPHFHTSEGGWDDYNDYDSDDDYENSSHDDMWFDKEALADQILKHFNLI